MINSSCCIPLVGIKWPIQIPVQTGQILTVFSNSFFVNIAKSVIQARMMNLQTVIGSKAGLKKVEMFHQWDGGRTSLTRFPLAKDVSKAVSSPGLPPPTPPPAPQPFFPHFYHPLLCYSSIHCSLLSLGLKDLWLLLLSALH